MTKTKNYYNGIAKGYKELYHKEQISKIDKIRSYLNLKNSTIVDLGAGDGVLNQFVDLKTNKLISIDISHKLLELNSNIEKRKFCLNIQNEKFPIESKSCNLLVSLSVFQDLENFDNAISEIKLVLKIPSIIIISLIKISNKLEFIKRIFEENFKIVEIIEDEIDIIFVLQF